MKTYIHLQTGYEVVLEPGETGYIVASCPQLPGCVSQGKTEAEALLNIDDAIVTILVVMKDEGEEIPVGSVTDIELDPIVYSRT